MSIETRGLYFFTVYNACNMTWDFPPRALLCLAAMYDYAVTTARNCSRVVFGRVT